MSRVRLWMTRQKADDWYDKQVFVQVLATVLSLTCEERSTKVAHAQNNFLGAESRPCPNGTSCTATNLTGYVWSPYYLQWMPACVVIDRH